MRLLQWGPNAIWLVSLKEKEDTRGEMTTWRGSKRVAIHEPRTEASEEIRPASTFILDF